MISKSNFRLFLALLLSSKANFALAYEFGLSVGQYEPFDGVVNSVYDNRSPSYLLRFGVPRDNGVSWTSTLMFHEFESRIANLENDVRMSALQSGFRKTFSEINQKLAIGIEPFFGASVGLCSLHVKPDSQQTSRSYAAETKYGFASSWEIGTHVRSQLLPHVDWEIKLTDMAVGRKMFGNLNMGGRIVSFGFQYSIPTAETH